MEIAPIFLAALIILGFMISAWKYGVILQMAGALSAAGGILAGLICFSQAPKLLTSTVGISLSSTLTVVISVVIGLAAWFILKFILKGVFNFIFNADSPLHNLTDGFPGAMMSLIPSVVLLFVLANGVRVTGTLMELRNLQHATRDRAEYSKAHPPKWPILTQWRNQIETIPFAADVLDLADPISKKPVRNLTALLISSKNPGLLEYLKNVPETSGIINSNAFLEVANDEKIRALNEANKRSALLLNPLVQANSRLKSLKKSLQTLDVCVVVENYLVPTEISGDGTSPATSASKPAGDPFAN